MLVKVSVLYPYKEGSTFDIDYYCKSHIPMVKEKLGAALKGVAVEHGLAGGAPGSPAPYIAMGHMLFDSVEAFQGAFGPHTDAIMQDVPNYTDIQPMLQISEVKM